MYNIDMEVSHCWLSGEGHVLIGHTMNGLVRNYS